MVKVVRCSIKAERINESRGGLVGVKERDQRTIPPEVLPPRRRRGIRVRLASTRVKKEIEYIQDCEMIQHGVEMM